MATQQFAPYPAEQGPAPPIYEPPPAGGYPPAPPSYPPHPQQPLPGYGYQHPPTQQQPGMIPPPPPPGPIAPTRIRNRVPVTVQCPHCRAQVCTRTHAETGTGTWVVAGACVVFGCWLGCCLFPFCMDECKDMYHDCPNCNRTIDVVQMM